MRKLCQIVFEEKSREIRLNDEDSAKKHEIQTRLRSLATFCEPLQCRAVLTPNTRVTTLKNIDKWLTFGPEQVFVLHGERGTGKTSVLSEMCRRKNAKATHFFHWCAPNLDHNEVCYVLRSFAHQLCDAVPDFVSRLPEFDDVEQILACADVNELLQKLLIEPLNESVTTPLLLLIDAIDQCSDACTMSQLVGQLAANSSRFIKVLVSCKGQHTASLIEQCGATVKSEELPSSGKEVLADMKKIFCDQLSPFMDKISLDGGLTTLANKANGNMLYARIVNCALRRLDPECTKLEVRDVQTMFPDGLQALLANTFNGIRCGVSVKEYEQMIAPLALALEPISSAYIQHVQTAFDDPLEALLDVIIEEKGENEGKISLCGLAVAEWLLDVEGECAVHVDNAQSHVAELCAKWASSRQHLPLHEYALRRGIRHMVAAKHCKHVATLLTSMEYLQRKMALKSVRLTHLLHDYLLAESLIETDITQKVAPWATFVRETSALLRLSGKCVVQVAANMAANASVKQAARTYLKHKPWLEHIAGISQTHCYTILAEERIVAVDSSPDGLSIIVLTQDETSQAVSASLVDCATAHFKGPPLNLKSIRQRSTNSAHWLPDNSAIFVGSFVQLLAPAVGGRLKPVTGFDPGCLKLSDDYSIDCSSCSTGNLICGFTDGQKKLVAVFDVIARRCVHAEQIDCEKLIAVCSDTQTVAVLIEKSGKNKLTVWNKSEWELISQVDVDCKRISKITFFQDSILMGSSLLSETRLKTLRYSLEDKTVKAWTEEEQSSLFHSTADGTCVYAIWKRKKASSLCTMRIWQKKVESVYRLKHCTASQIDAVLSIREGAAFISPQAIRIYHIDDLEKEVSIQDSQVHLGDLDVLSVTVLPSSNQILLTSNLFGHDDVLISLWDVQSSNLIASVTLQVSRVRLSNDHPPMLRGLGHSNNTCHTSPKADKFCLASNDELIVWKVDDKPKRIPRHDLSLICSSASESLIAMASESEEQILVISLEDDDSECSISYSEDGQLDDLIFLNVPGCPLLSSHSNGNVLCIRHWQDEKDKKYNIFRNVCFVSVSPCSDRLVIGTKEDDLYMQSSDCQFDKRLQTNSEWISHRGHVEFSPDATTLIATSSSFCRLWNADNGDVLHDIDCNFPYLIGFVNNTHVLFYDGIMMVIMDVASREEKVHTPLTECLQYVPSLNPLIATRGGAITGVCEISKRLVVLRTHNLPSAARQTTLQRMKSITKKERK
ncbi:DgyrCDS14030 [Dimorphilus gyrociliatus]|uniref:DgyrCDS14030 n=1 Tax=Dimorphilus gyrociliatus TaxID=2664684 RepID=A0A7I8WCC5_9ANNE|nr:DgyrCDS14030 [Dimorphilus gyrociliatus]